MTDRELLEAAAKAAGNAVRHWDMDEFGVPVAVLKDGDYWQPLEKNSLTDCMGDALRLAVKLRLNITFMTGLGKLCDQEFMQVVPRTLGHLAEFGPVGDDAGATIRRAIVRAAAAIGGKT